MQILNWFCEILLQKLNSLILFHKDKLIIFDRIKKDVI